MGRNILCQHPEEDKRLGTVGHIRMDFGRSSKRVLAYLVAPWPGGTEQPRVQSGLQQIVGKLREDVLKSRFAMERFCYEPRRENRRRLCTELWLHRGSRRYRYCLRCNPSPGDYNGYLAVYDLAVQRQNMARDKPW